MPGTDGCVSTNKPRSSELWTKKHLPFGLESLVINKKKREEFVQICLALENKVKILILQGPSGCGKNAMIDCFGEQYNYEIVRFKDERSGFVADVFGMNEGFKSEDEEDAFDRWYPDDLENMIFFIKSVTKCGHARTETGSTQTVPKASSFSSFSTKSAFTKKAATAIINKNT